MEVVLAETLVARRFLGVGTEVEIAQTVVSFDKTRQDKRGHYVIQEVTRNRERQLLFLLGSVYDGRNRYATVDHIVHIDGMTPEKFAYAYQLDPRGQPLHAGRKRGRKTTNELIALLCSKLEHEEIISKGQTLLEIATENDDEVTIEIVLYQGTILDEDPPYVEVEYQDGENSLIDPAQIRSVDGRSLSELLEDFRDHRRALREASQKEVNGENHQHRGFASSESQDAA